MRSARRGCLLMNGSVLAMLIACGNASAQTAAPSPAASSSPNGDASPEIIVTAQKRAENVERVPIAITVISSDQLERRGVSQVQDLSQASASLEFTTPSASPGGGGFVRGIGTESISAATVQPSVSVVLDGVVLGATSVSDLFDVARVEVLKGPQGTLFGSSVSAGVINITTRAPVIGKYSADLTSELASTGIGSEYDRHVIRVAVNLPVNDSSALRVAAYTVGNDGLSHDTYNGRNSSFNTYGVRVRYIDHLSDNLTFNLIGDYGHSLDDNSAGLVYRSAQPDTPLATALSQCGITPSPDNVDNCSNLPRSDLIDVGGVSGQFDLKIGNATLTSITSWRKSSEKILSDLINIDTNDTRSVFGSECNFVNCQPVVSLTTGNASQPQDTERTLFTQELRIASSATQKIEWVGGMFYSRSTYNQIQPTEIIVHPLLALGVDADLTLNDFANVAESESDDIAAFGNVTYHLTSSTRLIGGARITHSHVSENFAIQTYGGFGPVGTASGRAAIDDNAFTWRAGIEQDFAAHTMGYFTATTGYKPPEINDGETPIGNKIDLTPIRSERPTSFELGLKTAVLNNRFYVNADVFYTKIKDFQTQSCVFQTTLGLVCSDVNVPNLTTKGVELEVFGRPFRYTNVNISGIYDNAKYPDNFFGADGSNLQGDQLNYAPEFKLTGSFEQLIPLSEKFSLTFGADATFRTQQSMYLSSNPIYVVPGQTIINGRVGLTAAAGWSISFFARNLTNRIYPVQLYPTVAFAPGGLWQVLDQNSRRTVGFQLEAHF